MGDCCVCSRAVGMSGARLELTASEKEFVTNTTREPAPDYYLYCKPCLRLLMDRQAGAQLQKGVLQASLRGNGVPNAERIASKYHDFLVSHAAKKPVS